MIFTKRDPDTNLKMGPLLFGVNRCPHCAIASPRLERVWASYGHTIRRDEGEPTYWASYACSTCGSVVSAKGEESVNFDGYNVTDLFPQAKKAHEDIPALARTFLQQAFDTLHAPDAAAVMAGSSVDAMLKEHGYIKDSLYSRIDKALEDNLLTKGMAEWAHSVRLGSNRPRHADKDKPTVSADEAKQSVDFAEALGNFLFVLTAKINRGIEEANKGTS
ncbi:DUF4145 domain-containing protein [Ochrobactrum sp. MR34]|nr:DUF4145 domain-containing protein [Ochrobactrum sp. MR34]